MSVEEKSSPFATSTSSISFDDTASAHDSARKALQRTNNEEEAARGRGEGCGLDDTMTEEDAAALAAAAPLQAFGATPQGWQESLDGQRRILGDCVARKALGFVGGEHANIRCL